MALDRTQSKETTYYKAVVRITHVNNSGDVVHLMDAQIGQYKYNDVFDNSDDGYLKCQARCTECRDDHSKLPEYVKAAIQSLENNDYQLTITTYAMC